MTKHDWTLESDEENGAYLRKLINMSLPEVMLINEGLDKETLKLVLNDIKHFNEQLVLLNEILKTSGSTKSIGIKFFEYTNE